MTRDETKKILMILDASYPNFKTDDIVTQIDAWNLVLSDFDYKDIEMAVKTYIVTSGSAFAPSVSEIIAMIRKPSELTQMNEVTAWRLVRKAIGRGIYYSREEYDKLPEEVQSAVGDPEQIRQWAMLESSEIDTVIQSNFKRRFETMQKRRLEIEAMPAEMRELIKQNTKTLEDYRNGASRLPEEVRDLIEKPKLPERQIVRVIEAKPEEGGVSESKLNSGMETLRGVLG